jgi:hypothetical protein
VEEKRSLASGVLQYFRFEEKRGRGGTYFRRGKEHARRLSVPCRLGTPTHKT